MFGLKRLRKLSSPTYSGYILTDGYLDIAILDFKTDQAAGAEFGAGFAGLHHLGFHVDAVKETAEKLVKASGKVRADIDAGIGIPGQDFKYTGPDGVMFDVSEKGWKVPSD